MKLRKWNYSEHNYDDYEVPDEWNCKTYSNNLEELVNCPHCGKQIKYGDTYTSKEIHTGLGFGYGVCEECYEKEWNRRKESEEKYGRS